MDLKNNYPLDSKAQFEIAINKVSYLDVIDLELKSIYFTNVNWLTSLKMTLLMNNLTIFLQYGIFLFYTCM